jgi:HSP20 family protein
MTENNQAVVVKENRSWDDALEQEKWVAPLVDIYETDDDYILHVMMPGVSKEQVKIKLEDGSIVIMGRINYDEAKSRKYILKETRLGNYFRKFNISSSIDTEKIDAVMENGVMVVTLPKHERVKPKTIDIK